MTARFAFVLVGLCASVLAASLGFTQPEPTKPATVPPPEMKLPDGWTAQDMQACIEAATPGEMHEFLGRMNGTWKGTVLSRMGPDTEPFATECTCTGTALMDGRYFRRDVSGEMPGMGMFLGSGTYGYDNVAGKFQGVWIDNMSTTMMVGTGELSADRKTLTWTYTYTDPITRKTATMREVETVVDADTSRSVMISTDPKTGKEFNMAEMTFVRQK